MPRHVVVLDLRLNRQPGNPAVLQGVRAIRELTREHGHRVLVLLGTGLADRKMRRRPTSSGPRALATARLPGGPPPRSRRCLAESYPAAAELDTLTTPGPDQPASPGDPALLGSLPRLAGILDHAPPRLIAQLLEALDIQGVYNKADNQVTLRRVAPVHCCTGAPRDRARTFPRTRPKQAAGAFQAFCCSTVFPASRDGCLCTRCVRLLRAASGVSWWTR